ncbi:AAA family ATPase [Aliarcobacter butzleri]|uniref:AAA family ATPase n=1 Tax=Aliarcobacter butzleri TaxID=28197 RepID=UPI00263EE444|nr:AAA family ATPase [Aliarcobacter butzleri]MDN5096839.1 AAA family ATPase [Aliarcobacter butzleri]
MELVYLWVENYKNIQKQGFNFSPRFECEFDGENLTIKKNEKYVSIFPKNINVTAIVGENGSGKSQILKIIKDLDSTEMHNTKNIYVLINGKEIYTNLLKEQIKNCLIGYSINSCTERGNKLDYFVEKNLSISSTNYKNKEKGEFILASVFEKDDSAFYFINDDYIFTKYKINLESLPIHFELGSGIEKLDEKLKNPIHELINSATLNSSLKDENYYLSLFTLTAVKLLQFTLQDKNLANNKRYNSELSNLANNFTKENYLNFVNKIDLKNFEKGYLKYLEVLKNFDANKEELEKLIEKEKNINSSEIKKILESDLYQLFFHFTSNNFNQKFLSIDYLTANNLSFNSLSDGEQQKMVQLGFFVDELLKTEKESIKKLLLTFDEPDVFLHPNWQRNLISEFMIIINKYINKEFDSLHLILTSHSPFILSDIPKENVIFLEKYKKDEDKDQKEGNCKNVTKNIELKTFGANIHTLLSHGFFMKDGLMGEFAKKTIQDVIDYLDDKPTQNMDKQKASQIIQFVGEPFLKYKLKEKYNEKFLTKEEQKQNKIRQLEDELKRLKDDNTES